MSIKLSTAIILLLARSLVHSSNISAHEKVEAICTANVDNATGSECQQPMAAIVATDGDFFEENIDEVPVYQHSLESDEETVAMKMDENCKDMNEECELWASMMECEKNPPYMHTHCKKSCGICIAKPDMGEEQSTGDPGAVEVIQRSMAYLENEVLVKPEYSNVRYHCQNRHELCSFWASMGECEKNPNYMRTNCALACQTCLHLDMEQRCPLDRSTDALHPGDLNKLFENIVEKSKDEFANLKPVVLSRPSIDPEDEGKEPSYQLGPWVVAFDNFLSDEECDRLIDLGHELKYERSSNVGKLNFDGTSEAVIDDSRTSKNVFCTKFCAEDPLVKQVTDRIQNVTGIPEKYQEHLQLLKYQVGEYYKEHHDFIPHHIKRQTGPRVLTFFLYLNDVEEGGGTKFPPLNLIVTPKKGKALLWPNILDSNTEKPDEQTNHEALSVEKGIKYGANAWIHLRDFKTPFENGCI